MVIIIVIIRILIIAIVFIVLILIVLNNTTSQARSYKPVVSRRRLHLSAWRGPEIEICFQVEGLVFSALGFRVLGFCGL